MNYSKEYYDVQSEQRFINLLIERKNNGGARKNLDFKIDYSIYSQKHNNTRAGGTFSKPPPRSFNQLIPQNQSIKSLGSVNSSSLFTFTTCTNYTKSSEYTLQGYLGKGSYAQVRQAIHKQSGFIVAIKIYDKLKLMENNEVKKSVSREISLLSALSGTAK